MIHSFWARISDCENLVLIIRKAWIIAAVLQKRWWWYMRIVWYSVLVIPMILLSIESMILLYIICCTNILEPHTHTNHLKHWNSHSENMTVLMVEPLVLKGLDEWGLYHVADASVYESSAKAFRTPKIWSKEATDNQTWNRQLLGKSEFQNLN